MASCGSMLRVYPPPSTKPPTEKNTVSTLRQAPSLQLKKTPCLLSAPPSAKPSTPHIRHISHRSPLSDHHHPFILSDRGSLLSSISHLSAVDPATMTVDPATLFIPISINLTDRGNSAWCPQLHSIRPLQSSRKTNAPRKDFTYSVSLSQSPIDASLTAAF
jgi:hypothetical protein